MEKIKIRFFINTLAGGGAEKVLINLLRNMDPAVYEISLISVTGGVHRDSLPDHIHYKQIVRKNCAWKRSLIYHMPPMLFNRLFMRGNNNLEVAYLEGFPTKMLAKLKTSGKKLAFVHMDVTKDNTFDLLYKEKEKCISDYQSFDKVCFVSQEVQNGFFRKYDRLERAFVIKNVIDYQRIREKQAEPAEVQFTTNGLKIVVIGRLEPVKRMDRVIAIGAELQKEHAFQIFVMGSGKEYQKLLQMKKEKNAASVEFLGYCENPYPILAQADLLLCTSEYEGFSTVVSEALAVGVPVLTTDCAGMSEQLCHGKYGMIVENHTDGLLEGLRYFLTDQSACARYRDAIATQWEGTHNRGAQEYDVLFRSLVK